jgi:hypothetical protein
MIKMKQMKRLKKIQIQFHAMLIRVSKKKEQNPSKGITQFNVYILEQFLLSYCFEIFSFERLLTNIINILLILLISLIIYLSFNFCNYILISSRKFFVELFHHC